MAQGIYSGATSKTVNNIELDAGMLVKGDATTMTAEELKENCIGATSGGGSITIGHTTHGISVDGVPANTVGFYRKDADTAEADFTMIEITNEAIKKSVLAATQETDESGNVITTSVRDIFDEDYADASWIGTTSDGGALIFVLYNAICTDGFKMTVKDKSEGTYGLKLQANYTLETINDGCPYKLVRVPAATE